MLQCFLGQKDVVSLFSRLYKSWVMCCIIVFCWLRRITRVECFLEAYNDVSLDRELYVVFISVVLMGEVYDKGCSVS